MAIFVGATIIPLVGFIALAVEAARGYLMKTTLNYGLDCAGLAGRRVFSDAALVDATIWKFFRANLSDPYMGLAVDRPGNRQLQLLQHDRPEC